MKSKCLLPCLTAILLASPLAFGDTIAKWTFETSVPTTAGPYSPEIGYGSASGSHAGAATYSSSSGNGSSHSYSANTWAVGDYWQFSASTIGFQNVTISYDQISSSTGPGIFALQYSTDGSSFTQFGSTYIVSNAPSWSASTYNAVYTHSIDLSSITALNNASTVYFRVVCAANLSSGAATNTPQGTTTISASGTDRMDNFTISASTIPGFPTITTQPPANTVAYWGDGVVLTVVASGTSPTYQWYYPDMNHPLSDGASGHGVGIITNTATSSLLLTYLDPSQTGNYRVVVANSFGSVTSQVAYLAVNVRTPIVTNIAYVRSTLDHTNWLPTDTTNLYSVTGIVTTPFNLSGSGNSSEFFMQDGAAGICVFMGGDLGADLPNQGDLVRVIGPVANYDGLLEFNLSASNPSHSISSALSSGNPLPAPKYFDINDYQNIPYMETNVEGSLVVVSNVFLNQASLQFAPGAMNITNAWRKYISFYVNPSASDVIGQNVPRIAASIAGVMNQYTSTIPATNGYELDILQYSDLVPTTVVPRMPLSIQGTNINVVVSWWAVSPFTLQSASSPTGTYTDIGSATTPYTNTINSTAQYYRLKQ
ncbi:MAG: immunoglobulin domain-containing protein [Verrucomicrobiota bacterium]